MFRVYYMYLSSRRSTGSLKCQNETRRTAAAEYHSIDKGNTRELLVHIVVSGTLVAIRGVSQDDPSLTRPTPRCTENSIADAHFKLRSDNSLSYKSSSKPQKRVQVRQNCITEICHHWESQLMLLHTPNEISRMLKIAFQKINKSLVIPVLTN